MTNGYFKLQRRFFDHWLWTEKRSFSKAEAWIDLLQIAAYAPTKRIVRDKLLTIAEGELIASLRYLSERWGWGKDKIGTFLKTLESDSMIKRETRHGESFIIICNYRRYAVALDSLPDTDPDAEPTEARQEHDKVEEGKEGREESVPQHSRRSPLATGRTAESASEWSDRFPISNAQQMARVQAWINSMHPKWKARPHFTRAEQEELMGVLRFVQDLKDSDWRSLRAYMDALIEEKFIKDFADGKRFWQPDQRGQFVGSISDVLSHHDRWVVACRKAGIAINLGNDNP